MSREIPPDQAYKPRSALGDVTNQVGKRGFSSISNPDVKSAKKECRRVDSCKENSYKETAECALPPKSCSEISLLKGDTIDGVSKIACEIKEPCPPGVRQNATCTFSSAGKAAAVSSDNCQHTELVHTILLDENGPDVIVEVEEDERADSAVILQIESKGMVENNLGVDDGNDASLDNLDSSKDEYLDCSRLLESQESKCGLEQCIGQKGDGLPSACMDIIKACPCSFCMKAAYLWSDLHYQDIKGRIAVIKKSQTEATILVNRNSKDVARNFEKFSKLESDLTDRWKSLFLHMEDIFVREGNQLETSLSTLKEVIDNCKTDSEKN